MRVVPVLVWTLIAAGCGNVLNVTNPGAIAGSNLTSATAATGVVSGISYALSYQLNGIPEFGQSNILLESGVLAEEISSASGFTSYDNGGTVTPDADDNTWTGMQQARWVAENGVTTLHASLGTTYGTSLLAARANLLAGFANRYLGENMCQAVINGGPAQNRSVFFQRAEQYFTNAITIDHAAGDSGYATAGLVGRAAVRAWQGNWSGAVADAGLVLTSFEYDAIYDASNGLLNGVASETITTFDYSVRNSAFAADSTDPRTPSQTLKNADGTVTVAADGATPMQQQQRYTSVGQSVALAHGSETRLLEAENALMAGNIGGAFAAINAERAFYGLAPLTPGDLATAWATLRQERGAVLWLEGRRLWDVSRWFVATGPAHDATLAGRAQCLPIGRTELNTNPNL
jgi:hypothetical protein